MIGGSFFALKNISKSFGVTKANQNITLEIRRGTVHGLAGENGSGKSTLASMICGILQPDSGEMFKGGQPYKPATPIEANQNKVAMVVQELGVIGSLPPLVNMFLGSTDQYRKNGLVNFGLMKAKADEVFEKWGLSRIPMNGMAEYLSIEHRKVLELARALTADPDLLILDEVSQALSLDTRKMLYRFIEKFKADGRSILIISHDLEEMVDICDTVTILRDGLLIDTRAAHELDEDKLRQLMIGRELEGDYYRSDKAESYQDEVILKAEDLTVPRKIENISFELHRGEILGVCGLSDAGIHDLGMAIFGLENNRTGKLTYMPAKKELRSSDDVISTKGAYLSKDRDAYGLMLDASIYHNIALPNAAELTGKGGFLSPKKMSALVSRAAEGFEIKAKNIRQTVRHLSGGNRQKVNLSRWMIKDLDYIILDCPTRGVDVGVKAYIYHVLLKAKAQGVAVLLISDELQEALGMSDRIMVFRDHHCVTTLNRSGEFSETKIAEVML